MACLLLGLHRRARVMWPCCESGLGLKGVLLVGAALDYKGIIVVVNFVIRIDS